MDFTEHIHSDAEWAAMSPAQQQEVRNQQVAKAQGYLKHLMDKAGLFPEAQARLRKAFPGTNMGGAREAVKVEKRIQAAETDKYHQDHAAKYLSAVGTKLEDLKTGERVQ